MFRNADTRAFFLAKYLFYVLLMVMGWSPPTAMGQRADLNDDTKSTLSQRRTVHLYFSDRQMRFLLAEKRELLCDVDDLSLGQCILSALIEGPKSRLVSTLPKGTELKAFFITDDGTAVVDFNDAISRNHPGGVHSELFTVYAIVNSLTLNLSNVNRVQILIDGHTQETLAGHSTLSDPFKANILLIR
jgi:spore germination protein GerM